MDEDQKREDLERIDPRINSIFDSNEKISDEFKDLARACFGRIFYMLGEKNFRRWIDTRHLNAQIKDLVIESMTSEEIEKEPNTDGYYTRGKNRIRLKQSSSERYTKDVNTHETFHMITDHNDGFCTFIDEGLTEYMKGMAIDKPNTYYHNVNTVKFLHQVLGDSIIKAYLVGKKNFDENFLELINYDNQSSISDIKRFYSNLDTLHIYDYYKGERDAFVREGATPEIIERAEKKIDNAKQNYDAVRPEITLMYQKIIVGRVSQMSKNFEFYRDGDIDLEYASKTINAMVEASNIKDFIDGHNFIELAEWKNQVMKLAAEQVLENSHLLVSYTGEERENRKQELISKMTPKITATERQFSTTSPTIKNNDPLVTSESQNIPKKLFQTHLTDELRITEYIETVAKIATATGIHEEELEDFLAKYNIKYFGNINNFKGVNEAIIASIPKIQKLNELQAQRKQDTVTSEYKSLGNERFIEKRDNQVFYVELDKEGNFREEEVKHLRKTLYLKDGRRLDVDCSKGLPNLKVKINDKEIELGDTISLQDIKEMELTEAFSKDIRENIKNGKYTTILDDATNPWKVDGVSYSADIDKRSREIDFNAYIQDLKSTISVIPENQRDNFVKNATKQLLDGTYRISKSFQSKSVIETYTSMLASVSNLVKSEGAKTDRVDYNILENGSKILGDVRTTMVQENNSKAVVFFADENAELEYKRQKRIEKLKEPHDNRKYVQEASANFKYGDFYAEVGEIPMEEMPFHLSGVSITQPIDTRKIAFSYNEFANAAKEMISNYPANAREEIFNRIFTIQMRRAYTINDTDLQKNQDLSKALENVRSAISENVFSETEIEEEQMSSELEVLNNFKVERAKHGQKSAAVIFRDNHTKDMFYTFSDLISIVKKSGVRDGMVESEIQSIMKSHLQTREEEKNEEQPDIKD